MEKKQTAVEWLVNQINHGGLVTKNQFDDIVKQAKEMEKQQHGNTWDAAIKAHDERGHVIVRSMCDFDDYEIQ